MHHTMQRDHATPARALVVLLLIGAVLVLAGCADLGAVLSGTDQESGTFVDSTFEAVLGGGDVNLPTGVQSFSAPEGFVLDTSTAELGMVTSVWTHPDDRSAIVIMQLPEWLDLPLDEMINSVAEGGAIRDEFDFVNRETVEFMGDEVEVLVGEGSADGDEPGRAAVLTTTIDGKESMILYARPTVSWSDDEMRAFFLSFQ